MPDLLFLTSQKDAERIAPHFHELASVLRKATAEVFGFTEEEVEAYLIPWAAASNGARVQILGIASYTVGRQDRLYDWQNELAFAWNLAVSTHPSADVRQFGIEVDGKVETWPLMPIGKWGQPPRLHR